MQRAMRESMRQAKPSAQIPDESEIEKAIAES